MTSEIRDKLLELTKYCTERNISVQLLHYGARKNVMEETYIHGIQTVQIELGNPDDENLLSELTEFLNSIKLKNSL